MVGPVLAACLSKLMAVSLLELEAKGALVYIRWVEFQHTLAEPLVLLFVVSVTENCACGDTTFLLPSMTAIKIFHVLVS